MSAEDYLEHINYKNVDIKHISYNNKKIRIRCINGYHCITDYCRYTCKIPNNYTRSSRFKNYVKSIDCAIPLYYVQRNDYLDLMGTWISPLLLEDFLGWFNQ